MPPPLRWRWLNLAAAIVPVVIGPGPPQPATCQGVEVVAFCQVAWDQAQGRRTWKADTVWLALLVRLVT